MTTAPTDSAPARRDRFTPLPPEQEAAALADRLADWERHHAPEDAYQEWLISQIVVATVRLDRNLAHESAVRTYEAARAELCWDDDRRLDAEEVGAKLHKDPAKFRKRLEDTAQGADWLTERWDALGRIAGSGREWSEPQRALALDLLGVSPALRDGPLPFDDDPASQAALALAERQRLGRLRERVLVPLDGRERELAVSGLTLSQSPAMVRLRREESFWTRQFHRTFNEFRRARVRPDDATSPRPGPSRPAPAPPPEPEPEPESESEPFAPSLGAMAEMDRLIMAQLMKARQEHGVEDPFEAVDFRPTVAPVAAARLAAPSPSFSGNRHARRAQEARQRAQS